MPESDAPSPIEIPADLIAQQHRWAELDQQVRDHIARVEADRLQQFPNPDQSLERNSWPEAESAELARLRTERGDLGSAVREQLMAVAGGPARYWEAHRALLAAAAKVSESA